MITRQSYETPTIRLRGTFWISPDGSAASPRTEYLTTSRAKSHKRGEHLKDVVIAFGQMFPDVQRELHRVNVMGDVVAIELSIQGTFRGPMETPAGVIQPTGAKVNIPCADFFYMRNGKIERFDCYPALNIMLKQMGVPPDFASAVNRSTQR